MATSLYESEFELENELEGEGEAGLEGEGWLGAIGNVVGSLLGEGEGELEGEFESELELEGEGEFEHEGEFEISPIRKIYADAMMEHLGELAAEAETEHEAAEHFLPLIGMAASKLLPVVAKAVMPMAKKALPRIARAVTRVTPQLTRGIGTIARGLHRNPATRRLLKAVPSVARRTVGTIAKQAARGQRITPRGAVRTLARQARHVLANPRRRAQVLRQHNRLDRRFHHRWGRGMVRPHAPGVRQAGAAIPGPGGAVRYVTPGGVPVQPVAYGVPTAARGGRVARPATVAGGPVVMAGAGAPAGHVCPPCPACGTSVVTPLAASVAAPAPAYCRCCGQVLR